MKILAVGDPHGDIEKIRKIPLKRADLILLTGDIGKADLARARSFENIKRKKKGLPKIKGDIEYAKKSTKEIYDSSIEVLKYLSKHAPVYSILGNVWTSYKGVKRDEKKFGIKFPHLHEDIRKLRDVHFVRNSLRRIDGLRIGFLEYFTDTSWVREFKPTNYEKAMRRAKKQTEKAERVLERFGKNLNILVCHQPPYGHLDKVDFPGIPENWKGKHAGSKVILDYIKKHQPRYVFCGHIHEGEGKAKIGKTEVYNLGVAGYKAVEFD